MKKITATLCTLSMLMILTACMNTESGLGDSVYSSESSFGNDVSPNAPNETALLDGETKQALKLLKEYGDFYWETFPMNSAAEALINERQTISVDRGNGAMTYYKVVNGDIRTEEQFSRKLDTLLTEKAKREFLEDPNRPFEFSDGDLYIRSTGAGGFGAGMDRLYLDSIEQSGEDGLVVTVTSFGDKDNWGTSEDISDTYSATLVRTSDGLRADSCGGDILLDFWFYKEIFIGDEPIEFGEL